MKINFTKKEYRLLLDVIFMADWILHAHDTEPRSDTKEYSELIQRLMSYAKDMDCEDLVEFNKHSEKYLPSFEFDEDSNAHQFIDEFVNDTFWTELISRLAERDALTEHKVNSLQEIETEARFKALANAEDKWDEEFEKFSLDRISVEKAQSDVIH